MSKIKWFITFLTNFVWNYICVVPITDIIYPRRPWYQRTLVNPAKTAISNAYMDASGIGKVVTISQALFQGLPTGLNASGVNCTGDHSLRGGCACTR